MRYLLLVAMVAPLWFDWIQDRKVYAIYTGVQSDPLISFLFFCLLLEMTHNNNNRPFEATIRHQNRDKDRSRAPHPDLDAY